MRLLGLALLVPTLACSASTSTSTPAQTPATVASPRLGATMAQPVDDPARGLSPRECDALRAWIQESCETPASRSAVTRGWCADVMERTTSPGWLGDCATHVPATELACFLKSTDATAMMTCDPEIDG